MGGALGRALKRPVIVVLASRSADANWKGETALQETAHSAKTIILDGFDQMASIWYRMAERNGAIEHGPLLSNFGRIPVAVALRCSSHLLLFGP